MKFLTPVAITDSMLVSSSIAETDHPAWNAATAYAVGARVVLASTHSIYQRLVAGTTAQSPDVDAANWIRVGPTNRWRMFDKATGTLSSDAGSVTVTIAPGLVRGLALLDITANTVSVTMTASGATVYSRTVDLLSGDNVRDWYSYFFAPVLRRTTLVLDDLPPYQEGQITITVSGPSTVSVGTLAVGPFFYLGRAMHGASISSTDYSVKTTDGFGVTIVSERAYAKRISVQLLIEDANVDEVARQLDSIRAQPVVWVAAQRYARTVVYGFHKEWNTDIRYDAYSVGTLTIEGLS